MSQAMVGDKGVNKNTAQKSHSGIIFLLIFIFLAFAIVSGSYLFYQHYQQQFRAQAENQLTAIAELKVSELGNWRHERLANAESLFTNPAFSEIVQRFFEKTNATEARKILEIWLNKFLIYPDYVRVFLVDTRGVMRISVPDAAAMDVPLLPQDAAVIMASGQIAFIDLHRDTPTGPIQVAILVPIFAQANGRQPLGVVALRIDPNAYLYPFIKRWPVPSRTAETLLIRRDGNDALYLNELKFQKNTALNLRIPMTRKNNPAVMAVLGREGIVEGRDYRGVAVIAAVRHVPDSFWFLVARVDKAEVFAPLRERLWQMILLGSVLLLGSGGGLGFAWRQRRIHYYREQYRSAEALRESLERFQLANRATFDAIWDWNLQTDTLVWNENFQTLFGYRADEIEPGIESWTNRIHPEDLERVNTGIHAAIDSGQDHWSDQYRFRRQDGTYADIEDRGFIARKASGKPLRMIGAMQDITKRKRVESQREAALEEVRQKAEELQQRNAELTSINYAVSHDLKSPLVTVRTFLGYLKKDCKKYDAAAMDKDIHYIRVAAEKMARMLDELLELSRVGHNVNPPVDIPLQTAVQEALDLVAGQFTERGVKVKITKKVPMLHGDRPRLVEVFQNLLDNAVKFMGTQKAPLIEIGTETKAGETVIFVRDNGIGIDPRHQNKLFGLFEKLDANTEGTGIGLALVKRIVEVHGGRIWVESDGPGQGTCFKFTLGENVRGSKFEVRREE